MPAKSIDSGAGESLSEVQEAAQSVEESLEESTRTVQTELTRIKELLSVLVVTNSSQSFRRMVEDALKTKGLGDDFFDWFAGALKPSTELKPSGKPYMDQTIAYKCGCVRSLRDGPLPKICPEHGEWETRE